MESQPSRIHRGGAEAYGIGREPKLRSVVANHVGTGQDIFPGWIAGAASAGWKKPNRAQIHQHRGYLWDANLNSDWFRGLCARQNGAAITGTGLNLAGGGCLLYTASWSMGIKTSIPIQFA